MSSKSPKNQKFLDLAKKKVLFLDGAMGTSLFSYDLSIDDYGGPSFEGCPENLNYTKPEIVKEIHAKFLEAGADIIETNSFGGSKNVLAEYDLQDKCLEINKLAASLAREVADKHSTESKPRFVAGSIGPGTKLASLGHITYDELREGYIDHAKGLVEGGADYLLIETCQDPLQFKAAIDAAYQAFKEIDEENSKLSEKELQEKYPRAIISNLNKAGLSSRIRFPVAVQVTVETTGTLLVGSEISSALTTLSAYPIDIVGLNCATGPKEMSEHVRYLCENTEMLISCVPNAGIPENIGGHPHYPLGPEEFAKDLKHFVDSYGVNIVGGCCGTTFDHIAALAKCVGNHEHKSREDKSEDSCSSLYSSVPMIVKPGPLIVGERTNANGSRAFKNLLAEEDYDGIVAIAQGQEAEGAHFLDVCTAYVGRDEIKDMNEVITRLNTSINIPIMVDSTESTVIEEALKKISGKAIVNSVNLEDGEERVEEIAKLCNKYGAALVVLTIDESGMAKTAQKKLEVAERLYELLVNKHGMNPRDLIYDTLTFTLGSGDDELRNAGIDTIEAIRLIKEKYPEVKTILGVSNISFGLDAKVRSPLNSIFIYESMKAGLDMAIANSKKIIPLSKLDPDLRKYCEDLIYDRRTFKDSGETDYDPLMKLMACVDDIKDEVKENKNPYEGLEIEKILEKRIIDGNKIGIEKDLDIALAKNYAALEIVNKFLMAGMKVVGELFGAGEMQLPFVLQSATTMKTAVAYLEQFMDKEDAGKSKGTIVLATVRGDVHDIGKNLVNIILSNNGYEVVDLGIKQPVEDILHAVEEHKPNVIGLSGLLVKSTLIMKQNLELMEERKYTTPVILGGAALTKRYVEEDCQNVYSGKVYYGFDAFTDLKILNYIIEGNEEELEKLRGKGSRGLKDTAEIVYQEVQDLLREEEAKSKGQPTKPKINPFTFTEKLSSTKPLDKIPVPPFYGDKLIKAEEIDFEDLFKFINEDALIIGQWQFKKGKRPKEEYEKELNEKILPKLKEIKENLKKEKWLEPQIAYGYYPAKVSSSNPNLLEIYDEDKSKVIESFEFPRQTDGDHLCLSDYYKTKDPNAFNLVPFQVVTIGESAADYVGKFYKNSDFENYLYNYGFATEMTEALAEYAHAHIRKELGYGAEDDADYKKLIKCNYRGMRYSYGYPACPKIEDQEQLFRLLKPDRIGLKLSEEWQIHPEHSTSAILTLHPDAKYYNVKS